MFLLYLNLFFILFFLCFRDPPVNQFNFTQFQISELFEMN